MFLRMKSRWLLAQGGSSTSPTRSPVCRCPRSKSNEFTTNSPLPQKHSGINSFKSAGFVLQDSKLSTLDTNMRSAASNFPFCKHNKHLLWSHTNQIMQHVSRRGIVSSIHERRRNATRLAPPRPRAPSSNISPKCANQSSSIQCSHRQACPPHSSWFRQQLNKGNIIANFLDLIQFQNDFKAVNHLQMKVKMKKWNSSFTMLNKEQGTKYEVKYLPYQHMGDV